MEFLQGSEGTGLVEIRLFPKRKLGPQKALIKSAQKEPYLRHKMYENEVIRKGEIPSSNCYGNARGLAKLAASMTMNYHATDVENDYQILSKRGWQQMHDNASWELDAYLGNKIN